MTATTDVINQNRNWTSRFENGNAVSLITMFRVFNAINALKENHVSSSITLVDITI